MTIRLSRRAVAKPRGMTLVEIVLVIMVGVVLIYSATIVYLNAKDSAAVARARDKVLSFQAMVEQIAITNGTRLPTLNQAALAWTDRRTDARTSPWGGQITTVGVLDTGCPGGTCYGITGANGFALATYSDLTNPIYTPIESGPIEYRVFTVNGTASFVDFSTNQLVTVRGYAVDIRGRDGRPMLFTGGVNPI